MKHSSFHPPKPPHYMAPTASSKTRGSERYKFFATAAKSHTKDTLGNAANSLHTTASDYAILMQAWMSDPALQEAFMPQVMLTHDKMNIGEKVLEADLSRVAWGLGLGLQLNDDGVPIRAYHSGDMNEWRAWVGMNLEDNSAIVYFSNSHNGHVLAQHLILPHIELDHASSYFFKRYGFAAKIDELEPGWQKKPNWGRKRKHPAPKSEAAMLLQPKQIPLSAATGGSGTITRDRSEVAGIRLLQPGYMAPTKSSKAKEREIYSPFHPSPKPPWKP